MGNDEITFRVLAPSDDIVPVNSLLKVAYSELAQAGMRYAASHEDVEATRKNISEGECHLGILGNQIVSCAVLRLPALTVTKEWKTKGPFWYRRPDVTTFGRFAVHPSLQKRGIGTAMMDRLENRARELGVKELAIDTSENAHHLIRMYEKRGYRFIEHHQWEITNYRSVIMSKMINSA